MRHKLFHQDEDRGLVLDAIQGPDGKPQQIDHETEYYVYPGSLRVGTKWLSEPVTSSIPGPCQFEVIGSEISNGINCWVIRSDCNQEKNPLIPGSSTTCIRVALCDRPRPTPRILPMRSPPW